MRDDLPGLSKGKSTLQCMPLFPTIFEVLQYILFQCFHELKNGRIYANARKKLEYKTTDPAFAKSNLRYWHRIY
jgi:hypothetical protein